MSEYRYSKDPIMAQHLDYLRRMNKAKASKCAYCPEKSVGIIAVGPYIKYVCPTHQILHGKENIESFEE